MASRPTELPALRPCIPVHSASSPALYALAMYLTGGVFVGRVLRSKR